MKNQEKWVANRFVKDSKGKFIGTYNHKIFGYMYESVIRKYSKGKLIDVGCGDVPYYIFYKDLVDSVTCIDWGHSTMDLSYLDYEMDLNEPMSIIESNKFDTVLCSDVLEHIKNPEMLFSELVRMLKPNGNLIVTVPFLYWIHSAPYDYHRYSHLKLIELCEKHGLKVEFLDAYGGWPEVVFDTIYKGYNMLNLPFRKIFLYLFEKMGQILNKQGFVKRMSERTKFTFPMGYVLVAKKYEKIRN